MPVCIALVAAILMLLHLVGLGSVKGVRSIFDLNEFSVEIRSRRFPVKRADGISDGKKGSGR